MGVGARKVLDLEREEVVGKKLPTYYYDRGRCGEWGIRKTSLTLRFWELVCEKCH